MRNLQQIAMNLVYVLSRTDSRMNLRSGLAETPVRVAEAWAEWTSGYDQDPAEVLKLFDDGGESYDEMIVIRNIPVYSHCEHHLAAIFGTATVAYIPNQQRQRIMGLSKASRLVNVFAKRLQVQERLTIQIADAIQENLTPRGVGVQLRCRHLCMESRGVCQPGVETVTNALRGVMKTQTETRAEFMALA